MTSSEGGQISETSLATPDGGADGAVGTDDGIPPAQNARPEAGGDVAAHPA